MAVRRSRHASRHEHFIGHGVYLDQPDRLRWDDFALSDTIIHYQFTMRRPQGGRPRSSHKKPESVSLMFFQLPLLSDHRFARHSYTASVMNRETAIDLAQIDSEVRR